MVVTTEFRDILSAANAFFSTAGNNNAIAITPSGNVMYADRSVVYRAQIRDMETIFPIKQPISLISIHKYVIGLIQVLSGKIGAPVDLEFNVAHDVISYISENTRLILASEPTDINIPTEAEWESLLPSPHNSASASANEVRSALAFFSGFYEASVWKPIQIVFDENGSYLYYKHPTTEIKKEIDTMKITAPGSAVISSEVLEKILNSPVDTDDILFEYNENANGVRCVLAEGAVDSLMAILTL
jgi:hypothetical protein